MVIYGHDISIVCPECVFGDGQHETTRFLLYYMHRYARGRSVIDAGCGTGILGIFANKCGASSVTAIDYDANAIECAEANAKANDADIEVRKTDIKDADIKAEVVTANLARWDAHHHLPYIAELVCDGGMLITTWYKEIPSNELTDRYEVIDHIEGIDYDCYALQITS